MKCIDSPCLLALRVPPQRVDLQPFAAGTLPSVRERADPIADTVLFRGDPLDRLRLTPRG